MLLIKKTISLSNQPPLSEADLGERALDWLSELEAIVPVEQLQPSLSRAFKNHTSNFPINVFGILEAYKQIEAEESAEKERADTEERTLNRVAFCTEKHNHKSSDEAIQQYFVGGHWEWLPCVHCRPDAYWQRVKDIKLNAAAKSNEAILAESEENKIGGEGVEVG